MSSGEGRMERMPVTYRNSSDGFDIAAISVRVVHIDFYQTSISSLSSSTAFHAALLTTTGIGAHTRRPIVRIFGSTPAGQHVAVHLHGALPYFYLPLPDNVSEEATPDFIAHLRQSLESAMRNMYHPEGQVAVVDDKDEGDPGEKGPVVDPKFISDIIPVIRTSIYGYQGPKIFLKVSAWAPNFVPRMATIAAAGGLGEHIGPLQPFESHIPFTLQVMTDLGLVGMGYANFSACKFRGPLPDISLEIAQKPWLEQILVREFGHGMANDLPDLVWTFDISKKSTCELELDAYTRDVLNCKGVDSVTLGEKGAHVAPGNEKLKHLPSRFVAKSLKVLWEEEMIRTGKMPQLPGEAPRDVVAGAELTDVRLQEHILALMDTSDTTKAAVASPTEEYNDVAAWLRGEIQDGDSGSETLDESHESEWADIAECTQIKRNVPETVDHIPQFDGPDGEDLGAEKRKYDRGKARKRKRLRSGNYAPLSLINDTQVSGAQANEQGANEERRVPEYIAEKSLPNHVKTYAPLINAKRPKAKRVRWKAGEDIAREDHSPKCKVAQSDSRNTSASFSAQEAEPRVTTVLIGKNSKQNASRAREASTEALQGERPVLLSRAEATVTSPVSSKKSAFCPPCGDPDASSIPRRGSTRLHAPRELSTGCEDSDSSPASSANQEVKELVDSLLNAPFQAQTCSGPRDMFKSVRFESESSTFPSPSLGSQALILHPKVSPPSLAKLLERFRTNRIAPVDHPVPFFSRTADAPCGNVTYAGVRFKVPTEARMIEPYVCVVDGASRSTPSLFSRLVTPAAFPPSIAQLRISERYAENGLLELNVAGLDSMGRRVKTIAAFGGPGSNSQSQTQASFPRIRKRERLRRRLDTGIHGSSSDDSEDDHEVGSIVDGLSLTPQEVESSPGGKNEVIDKRRRPLLERPSSPKYDERSFFMALPSLRNRTLSQKGKFRTLTEQKRDRNVHETGSMDKSEPVASPLHEHQNLTILVVEVLAKSRGSLLPDPRFDSLCAVALLVRDEKKKESNETERRGFVFVNTEHGKLLLGREGLEANEMVHFVNTEQHLLDAVGTRIKNMDADIFVGYETQNGSIGYMLERAAVLEHSFARLISRMPDYDKRLSSAAGAGQRGDSAAAQYFRRKGVDIGVSGRHVINLWRVVRSEVKLAAYSLERVVSEVLSKRIPIYSNGTLSRWFCSSHRALRAVKSLLTRARAVMLLVESLGVLGRTGELARVFGIDFMSVLTRGSQFRVESMMIRVAHAKNFILLAAQRDQVFKQPAIECLPLVMEPRSAFYPDPVIVLDFQSLYPSMIIAHNLCFSTMLGNVRSVTSWRSPRTIGVLKSYIPPALKEIGGVKNIYVAPNGEAFATAALRRGILPTMLQEVLDTRVMVKNAMKNIDTTAGAEGLIRLLNARQFGLKMIANVTYGYTSASFSGRMPCAGLADAIVQSGRAALEKIIAESEDVLRPRTGLEVVYGDTDSLFVKVPGATRAEAFAIGEEICSIAQGLYPEPIKLQLEKVFHPCTLVTKKRYVGYAYNKPGTTVPIFDAKGIETVRRDSCAVVQRTLEKSLRILFETCDISRIKRSVQRTMQRVLSGSLPLSDFIFRKEVRLGAYKEGHLPPAAIVATKAMEADPRAAPRYGERIPFVVIYDKPGAPLKDSVCSPGAFLEAQKAGRARLNATYYITKQILPSLDRIFSLLGVKVTVWYAELPRPYFKPLTSLATNNGDGKPQTGFVGQSNMYRYYVTQRCQICQQRGGRRLLSRDCTADTTRAQQAYYILASRQRALENEMNAIDRICTSCVGGDELDSSQIGCKNLECRVTLLRHSHEQRIDSGREALAEASLACSGTVNPSQRTVFEATREVLSGSIVH